MTTETFLLVTIGLLQTLALLILGTVWGEIKSLRTWRHTMDSKITALDTEGRMVRDDMRLIKIHIFRAYGKSYIKDLENGDDDA